MMNNGQYILGESEINCAPGPCGNPFNGPAAADAMSVSSTVSSTDDASKETDMSFHV